MAHGWFACARSYRSAQVQQHWLRLDTKKRLTDWETQFKELVQYKANHGNCNVPTKQGQLGICVHNQRRDYKKGKLVQGRIIASMALALNGRRQEDIQERGKLPQVQVYESIHCQEKKEYHHPAQI